MDAATPAAQLAYLAEFAQAPLNSDACMGNVMCASDVHGERTTFAHLLRSGCGAIRQLIDKEFGPLQLAGEPETSAVESEPHNAALDLAAETAPSYAAAPGSATEGAATRLSEEERAELATLIYYPHEKLPEILEAAPDASAKLTKLQHQLIALVMRALGENEGAIALESLPKELRDLIEFASTECSVTIDSTAAAQHIVTESTATERPIAAEAQSGSKTPEFDAPLATESVYTLCLALQRSAVKHLHVVGDVYDRGPEAELIMDDLMAFHSVDIQWGNHDIVWMGASQGQRGCIAHVVRNCARYGNLSILEDAYNMDLEPLNRLALEAYAEDPCVAFGLKGKPDLSPSELERNVKIQKAMAILQFKVEAQIIDDNPSFNLDERKQLHLIDHSRGTVVVDGIDYELTDRVFPTVDPSDPYRLTEQEEHVMQHLVREFQTCERLQRHMRFLLDAGSLYHIDGNKLLLHACVPLNDDGTLKEANVYGRILKGRALYDEAERLVRQGFDDPDPAKRKQGIDLMWWLWLSPCSPLFAKSKMATFELYLIAEKAARKEAKNPFYSLLNDQTVAARVFEDFGLDPKQARVVCGHVPVKVKDGESPIKCGGHVLAIDGGFSSAYQPTTGIAGLMLIENQSGLTLHAPGILSSREAAVHSNEDVRSRVVEIPAL